MKQNKILKILLTFAILSWITFVATNLIIISPNENMRRKENLKKYNKIRFKGKVIKIKSIKRGGRTYGIMCVKLDYSSVQKFYSFDEFHCLKIEKGIATLPTGALGNEEDERIKGIFNSVYVEVNLQENGKMYFYDKNGKIMIENLYYRNNNLTENDMDICRE